MFCVKCGEELQADSTFCPSCSTRLGEEGRPLARETARGESKGPSSQQGHRSSGMKLAATILGITGGIAAAFVAWGAMIFGGIGPLGFAGLFFALVGIVGGAIAIPKPKIAGILMLIGGIGGNICVNVLSVLCGALLIIGGILALIAARKPQSA